LATNGIVPGIPTAQIAAVEPHFDAGEAQGDADPLGRARILRGIAQKHGACTALDRGTSGMRIDIVHWIVCASAFEIYFFVSATQLEWTRLPRGAI